MQQQSSLVPELERLQQLHASGFLTDTELVQAKAKLLGTTPTDTLTVSEADAMLERLDHVERRAALAELQLELSRLEQTWQSEEATLVATNEGQKKIPSLDDSREGEGTFKVQAVVILILAIAMGVSLHSVLVGISVAVLGILIPPIAIRYIRADMLARVVRYETARRSYDEQRRALEAKILALERRK